MLGRISLGSLVYVVLLRTAMRNFGQLRDLYLPTNTLAALANLAPNVAGLHAHAAQRLVALAGALGKRYLKVVARLDALAAGPPGGGGGTQQQGVTGGGAQQQQQQQQLRAGAGAGAGGTAAAAAAAQEELRERLAQDEEVRRAPSTDWLQALGSAAGQGCGARASRRACGRSRAADTVNAGRPPHMQPR